MNNKLYGVVLVAAFGAVLWLGYGLYNNSKPAQGGEESVVVLHDARPTTVFSGSAPAQGETLFAIPKEVVVRFNSSVVAPSHFHINYAGDKPELDLTENHHEEYGEGDAIISSDGLSMTRAMRQDDVAYGVYRVKYKSCVIESSCEIGNFFFRIK